MRSVTPKPPRSTYAFELEIYPEYFQIYAAGNLVSEEFRDPEFSREYDRKLRGAEMLVTHAGGIVKRIKS